MCCITSSVSRLAAEYSASAVELRGGIYGEGLGLREHAFIFVRMLFQYLLQNGLEAWVFGERVGRWRDSSSCTNR